MGLTYLVLTVIWFAFYIFLIDKISAFMKKPKTQRYIQGLTGIVLIGFGIKLAFEKIINKMKTTTIPSGGFHLITDLAVYYLLKPALSYNFFTCIELYTICTICT